MVHTYIQNMTFDFLMVVALAAVIGSHNDGMIFFPLLHHTYNIHVCSMYYVESLDVAVIVDISVLL